MRIVIVSAIGQARIQLNLPHTSGIKSTNMHSKHTHNVRRSLSALKEAIDDLQLKMFRAGSFQSPDQDRPRSGRAAYEENDRRHLRDEALPPWQACPRGTPHCTEDYVMSNPFGGSTLLPATNPFAPPPPPAIGIDPHAAWRPQPNLRAALRAAAVRARLEWKAAVYDLPLNSADRRYFHGPAADVAIEALIPHLPQRLAAILGEAVASWTCPPAVRWPRLFSRCYDPDQ
jgi:hypothetical protein